MNDTQESPTRLSAHFTLEELTRSATATRLNIDNRPDAACVERLRQLCHEVLEPLRQASGPITITSGYRCPRLNRAVGGSAQSQHLLGEAADISTPTAAHAERLFTLAQALRLPFDQLLLEHRRSSGTRWLHVSHTRRRPNRGMAKRIEV